MTGDDKAKPSEAEMLLQEKDRHVVVRAHEIPLSAHNKAVTCIQFNHEGDLLLSSSKDTNCSACAWHTRNGELLGSFTTVGKGTRNYDSANGAIAVNRYSTMVATASTGEDVMLWSLQTGDNLAKISRPPVSMSSVAFSYGDDKLLTACKGRGMSKSAVLIYNLPFTPPKVGQDIEPVKTEFNPVVEHELESKEEKISWATWGPTNDSVYFAVGNTLRILDVETNTVVLSKEIHDAEGPGEGMINRFKFAPDYLTLATASTDGWAKLVDFRDLTVIQGYHSGEPVNDVSISPIADHVVLGGGLDAQMVTTQGGASTFDVKVFHKVRGTQLGQISKRHFGTITAMSLTPDGRGLASGAADGFIKLFRFDEKYDSAIGRVPIWSLKQAN
ncbi:WD domain, G-beta repeat, putative [Angomonas deanei]|uniref:Serine-threonine kinase receptor-associated protein n=1 Tax=Angomonas deanei TaxID=59799 RepID=A0A7G2BZN2_9TRYP|nr:WD domain, G-beta repeat, putative [Angomonas deanei]